MLLPVWNNVAIAIVTASVHRTCLDGSRWFIFDDLPKAGPNAIRIHHLRVQMTPKQDRGSESVEGCGYVDLPHARVALLVVLTQVGLVMMLAARRSLAAYEFSVG